MPRELASNTQLVYWWAWRWPWASAADIARVTGLKASTVSNALRRGETELKWFASARLGRTFKAADRYVVTNKGVAEMGKRFGWETFWWHTADAVRALARRLEVLEMAYMYLPDFWQSNAVSEPSIYVCYAARQDTTTGEPARRPELVELNWRRARLVDFHWLESKPFEAIATYSNSNVSSDSRLHLPVLWRGFFQKPSDITFVRQDMDQLLVQHEQWWRLPLNQAVSGHFDPGMIVFCPDRVSAAMVRRHWRTTLNHRECTAMPAIIDAQGQVVQAMDPPTSRWQAFHLPPRGGDLKDIPRTVASLGNGAYAAVNGLRRWRTYRAVDGSPGVTRDQIAASLRVDTTVTDRLLAPMVEGKVLIRKADGFYLDQSGRGLLADCQRRSRSGVKRRWGVYAKSGEYRRAQRLHNQGQAQAILELRQHGFQAFPALGVVIEDWYQGRKIRVVPDAFAVLSPGVLVAIEFERSARSLREVEKKALNYSHLAAAGNPIPVLFVMDTAVSKDLSEEAARKLSIEAARNLASLRCTYLLATTLAAVKEGPHGQAIFQDGTFHAGGDSGCWWYWYKDEDAPSSDAPIDLWTQIYVQNDENMEWRIPLNNPWRLVPGPIWY